MMFADFHVHTSFCDGKNSAEEMVKAAILKNMPCIGLVHHSYTSFDESYCIKKGAEADFKAEICRLQKKYDGKIKILCGVEQDYFSPLPSVEYDYIIGSVHYIKVRGNYYPVDEDKNSFDTTVKKVFGGDYFSFAEEYFNLVSEVVEKTKPNIIGHFDLVSKFNEKNLRFNEDDERYLSAAFSAVAKLARFNVPFEINTGAISRGYKSNAYPSEALIKKIIELNGRFILSSDAHNENSLCFNFEKYNHLKNYTVTDF